MNHNEGDVEKKLKDGIDVLNGCAITGATINHEKREWFEGYQKACADIKASVVEAAFSGKPLPVRWQERNINSPIGQSDMLYAVLKDGRDLELTVFEPGNACTIRLNQQMAKQLSDLLIVTNDSNDSD